MELQLKTCCIRQFGAQRLYTALLRALFYTEIPSIQRQAWMATTSAPRFPVSPSSTKSIPFPGAIRRIALVFALLAYSLRLRRRRMSRRRRVIARFLARRTGIVSPCRAPVARSVAWRSCACLDFKRLVGCDLLAVRLEFGLAISSDLLLGEIVCSATGYHGIGISGEKRHKEDNFICLPTHREPHPSLERRRDKKNAG